MSDASCNIQPIPSSPHGSLWTSLPKDECISGIEAHVHRGEIRTGSVPGAYAPTSGYRPLRVVVRKMTGIKLNLQVLQVREMGKVG